MKNTDTVKNNIVTIFLHNWHNRLSERQHFTINFQQAIAGCEHVPKLDRVEFSFNL